MASSKELEKELKAMMGELMSFTTKRMADVERNLKAYIDKEIATSTKSAEVSTDKKLENLKKDLEKTALQSVQLSKSFAGMVEKNLLEYINKKLPKG